MAQETTRSPQDTEGAQWRTQVSKREASMRSVLPNSLLVTSRIV